MRVLVCGGRDYSNFLEVQRALNSVLSQHGEPVVIHGGASGADAHAARWAELHGVMQERYDAEWRRFGRRAGPLRNQRMLEEGKPDLVIAFPGGKGTADMKRRARAANIPVEEWGSA